MNEAAPRIPVPIDCLSVSPTCPVEGTLYGYTPSLAANAFFTAYFGLAFLLQLYLGIRYKTWTYMIAVGLGCLAESIGYIGRIILHDNAYNENGFIIQIVCLIFAPAFLAAGVYLTLKHVVIQFGEKWSRLRPNWYTWIFIICDITSLVLQSVGGAMASTAEDGSDGSKVRDMGTDLMIAGIIWQVVVLAIFGLLVLEYGIRTYRCRDQLSASAIALWENRRFKFFCGAVVLAYVTILARCIYRIPELLGGWGNDLMRIELEFIMLEGVMIALTVTAQTVCHPGLFFPALGNTIGKKGEKYAGTSSSESNTETMRSV